MYSYIEVLLDIQVLLYIEVLLIDPDKEIYERKIVIIFLPINLNMCFWCSKEPSHLDSSFEYPQHMFWMRNKENKYPIRTLIWRPDC